MKRKPLTRLPFYLYFLAFLPTALYALARSRKPLKPLLARLTACAEAAYGLRPQKGACVTA